MKITAIVVLVGSLLLAVAAAQRGRNRGIPPPLQKPFASTGSVRGICASRSSL